MIQQEQILIAKHFIQAAKTILSTMACITPEVGKPFVKDKNCVPADISAVIGVTGCKTGTIAVSFSRASAMIVLEAMLGDDITDVEQDVQDIVGEIANMVSGQARASLDVIGLNLQGSTPSVITGNNHCISHKAGGEVIAIPFTLMNHESFVIEFCFQN